jgi:hypothetical protein
MPTPKRWSQYEVGPGDIALLGFTRSAMHLIAPPAAQFRPDEPDAQRTRWRHLVWFLEGGPAEPAVTVDVPDCVAVLTTADVVTLLSEEHHGFVRRAMARQLARAALYGTGPEAGACVPDRYARPAGRTVAWISTELATAFPDELWFTAPSVSVSIPGTVDEFLLQLPPAPSEAHAQVQRWAATRAAWEEERGHTAAELPDRFQGRQEASRKRPGLVFKIVRFVGHLPVVRKPDGRFADGFERLSDRLEGSVERSVPWR